MISVASSPYGASEMRRYNKNSHQINPFQGYTVRADSYSLYPYGNNVNDSKMANLPTDMELELATQLGLHSPSSHHGAQINNLESTGPVASGSNLASPREVTTNNGSNNSANQNAPQNQLPPPIMLFVEENYKVQMAVITKIFPKIRSHLTGDFLKLYTDSAEERCLVVQLLKRLKFQFYKIKAKAERPIKVVIKGLPRTTNPEEIKQDLEMLTPSHTFNIANYTCHRNDGPRTADIEYFIQTASNCIPFEDFNASHNAWNCKNNTNRGRHLFSFANMLNLNIAFPSTPTRFGRNSANTIDIALIKNFYYPFTINSIDDLSSDHNPVFLNFNFKLAVEPPNPRAVSTDWNVFKTKI
ncbi:RNA-directed DNA polymerase from mobile element jockey [Trichonephila clavipes]|nr:RNA-directed DNA polymerase from mobile element jockey [Trichonephila clavipes]